MADRNDTVASELGPGKARSGPDVSAFYNFRLAVLLEGIYQRFLRDPSYEPQHDIGRRALAHVDRAIAIVRDEAG